MKNNLQVIFKYLCITSLFLLSFIVSANTPIHGPGFNGADSADARIRLIGSANTFLGTPYRYGGLDRRGLDCSGFVHLAFREGLNVNIPRTTEGLYDWAMRIPNQELQPGDLVFFITVGNRVSHVGIYIGDGKFIHSASEGPSTGVIISQLSENYWRRTYLGAGRALPWDLDTARAMTGYNSSAPGSTAGSGSAGSGNVSTGAPATSQTAPVVSPAAPTVTVPVNPVSPTAPANPINPAASQQTVNWAGAGLFTSFGASWNWGSVIQGMNHAFGGISAQTMLGFKWSNYMAGIQFKPGWNSVSGTVHLPFHLIAGTERINIFTGPVYYLGNGGTGDWQWELGFLASLPSIIIGRGAVSLYGELALMPNFSSGNAEIRVSTGFRYLIKI